MRGSRDAFARKEDAVAAEAVLEGIYIIRTSVDAERMDAPECVRSYKALVGVERAFRSLKTVDLKVRPVDRRTADRVRAHIFLCMPAYYVEWYMRHAWRKLMFADTEQHTKARRDPVAVTRRSATALAKVPSRTLSDGTPAHSFSTLMAELAGASCAIPAARPQWEPRRPPSRSPPSPMTSKGAHSS